MNNESHIKLTFRAGVQAGFPIFIGYFPTAMAFGLLAKTGGLTLGSSVSFSVFVFAGASQFMALNLLRTGAAVTEIVIATFLLNLRHLLMSAALATRIQSENKRWFPVVAFGVTDETFAVAATQDQKLTMPFLLTLEVTAYVGWVSGTGLGYLIGSALPVIVQNSMAIALYAMFIAILTPQVKNSIQAGVLALGAGALNAGLSYGKLLPSGWNLIIAIIVIALLGALVFKDNAEVVRNA